MEKASKDDYINVYVLSTLNEIKEIIRKNIKLDEKKEKEIDRKMSLVLNDLINANFKNLQVDSKGNLIYTLLPIVDKKENEKVRLSLILYYVALYYDNVDLLKDLLKENVAMKGEYLTDIRLQYLDKSISSKFDKEEYVKMIKKCGYIFRTFAGDIKDLPEEEREKYIERFSKLMKAKYELISTKIDSLNNTYSSYLPFHNLFDKTNLDIFTDEVYLNATVEQLEMMGHVHYDKYSDETCERLNNLMIEKGFSTHLRNLDLMMELFTDEELFKLSYDISDAICVFSKTEESINKIVDFLERRPDLARCIICVSQEDFMRLDNYTLIEFFDSGYIVDYDYNNFNNITKLMAPKAAIKRLFGAYKKPGSQESELKLTRKNN